MPSPSNPSAVVGLFALLGALGCAASAPSPDERPGHPTQAPAAAASEVTPSGPVRSGPIGSYLDRQLAELQGITSYSAVERRSDALVVSLESDALFDERGIELTGAGAERVRAIARTLQQYPKERVIVKGHTDGAGDERASQRLSEDRADSVRDLLIAEGVAPSRITALGLGGSLPTATNATAEGRQQNRRIELELRPDDEVLQGASSQ
jgi:outer membrane protein OmpA-like peptidoglycan-associated protein